MITIHINRHLAFTDMLLLSSRLCHIRCVFLDSFTGY